MCICVFLRTSIYLYYFIVTLVSICLNVHLDRFFVYLHVYVKYVCIYIYMCVYTFSYVGMRVRMHIGT